MEHPRAKKQGRKLSPQEHVAYVVRHWGTADEVMFLEGLGGWGPIPGDRRQALRQYLMAMSLRAEWGGVNVQQVRQAAQQMLAAEVWKE